ncbi:MAG: hypothetical protein ABWY78_08340, partial [Microvirga sp.]
LEPGEQVKYWSVLLGPLLSSDDSKALMRQLLSAIHGGDQNRIDSLLQEAIETGTAASLIFDKSRDPSLEKFLVGIVGDAPAEASTASIPRNDAAAARVADLETALRQSDEKAEAARRELDVVRDRLSQASAANEKAEATRRELDAVRDRLSQASAANAASDDVRNALAAIRTRADALTRELADARAQVDSLRAEKRFIPSTVMFRTPPATGKALPEWSPVGGPDLPEKHVQSPAATGSTGSTAALTPDVPKAVTTPMPMMTPMPMTTPMPPERTKAVPPAIRAADSEPVAQASPRKRPVAQAAKPQPVVGPSRTRAVELPALLRPDGID